MRRWVKVIVAALFIVTVLGLICRVGLRPREPRYQGKTIEEWVQEWVSEQEDGHPVSVLLQVSTTNHEAWYYAKERRRYYILKAIRTKDNALRKRYIAVQAALPKFVSHKLPEWQDPAPARSYWVRWFGQGEFRDTDEDFWRPAVPALCEIATTDPEPKLRLAAVRGLSNLGLSSEEAFPIMLAALANPDVRTRESALRWVSKTTPHPEKVVPLLVSGLADPAAKTANAAALRRYGSRASFAAQQLIALAQTNDPAISSVAKWALKAVDPKAAAAAGLQLE